MNSSLFCQICITVRRVWSLDDKGSEKDVTKDLTKRREAIIAMVTFNNSITIDEIADSLHMSRRTFYLIYTICMK